MGDHVLVIGGTLLDTKGKPDAGLAPSTSNPGRIRYSRGGTARNVAENLARLGTNVILITAVGDDLIGKQELSADDELVVGGVGDRQIRHPHGVVGSFGPRHNGNELGVCELLSRRSCGGKQAHDYRPSRDPNASHHRMIHRSTLLPHLAEIFQCRLLKHQAIVGPPKPTQK